MRKYLATALVCALGLSGVGCVMVIGVHDPDDRDVVEVNGETYLIDHETGKAHRVPSAPDKHIDAPKRDTDK